MRKSLLDKINEVVEQFKTVNYEPIPGNHFLSIESYNCHLNNGEKITREKILKNNKNGNASVILPITKEGKILLTIQPRVFTEKTVGISFPAGYKEENESYEEAARRELEEETGYHAEKLIEVCAYYQDDGCSAAFNKGFIALNCEKKQDQHLDDTEFIKYIECDYEDVLELVEKGYICDGNSLLLVEKIKEKRKEYV